MPLTNRFDQVGKLRIHALVGGRSMDERGAVVLVHGAAVSSRHMARTAEALAAAR